MALTSNEISETKNDEANQSSSDSKLSIEHDDVEHLNQSLSAIGDEEQQSSTSFELDDELPPTEKSISIPSTDLNKANLDNKRRNLLKARSVSFAPTVEEYEIPARSSVSSDCSTDYIDALVESYKLQTSTNPFPLYEEKKYVPKTTRSRLNPNWREHRLRHLMNKLEELSLWDREEELKASQAQCLREQKLEQIQDRQRNNDLCLHLMRQRHESEMESAVLLDQVANSINNENISATIARTIDLVATNNALIYDLPVPPPHLKRRVQQEQEKLACFKTPIGRYRQFETKMNNKLEKINENLQPDREIMRAYSPYYSSIPTTVVPLFSETYASLLRVPDSYSGHRYNRYHHSASPSFYQSPQHASSPDYETRARSHSNRDVRVPLKEEVDEDSDHEDNDDYHNHARLRVSPSRRSTSIASSTASSLYDCSIARDYSLIHSPQPMSNSIHRRTLNDDLNALTHYSYETNKKSLQKTRESSYDMPTKQRSSSIPTNKRVAFMDLNDDDDDILHYHKSSKAIYQPEMLSLSSVQ